MLRDLYLRSAGPFVRLAIAIDVVFAAIVAVVALR